MRDLNANIARSHIHGAIIKSIFCLLYKGKRAFREPRNTSLGAVGGTLKTFYIQQAKFLCA